MEKLEQFIKENREMFNQTEPPEGHFERFESRLLKKRRKTRMRELYRISRVAAVVLLLITTSLLIYQQLSPKPSQPLSLGDLSQEMADVEFFFISQVNRMTQTIREYPTPDNEAIKAEMLRELENRDSVYTHLQKEMGEFPGEERIVRAMIQYYQTKLLVVQRILTQLQNIESNNETNIKPNENINF